MSAPRRLIEEGGNSLELALLRSAKDDDPPPSALPRAMIAVGVGGAALSGGAAAGVFATPAGGLVKWAINLVVMVACGLGAGAIFMGEPGKPTDSRPIPGQIPAALAQIDASEAARAEALPDPANQASMESLPQYGGGEAAGSQGAVQKLSPHALRSRASANIKNKDRKNSVPKPSLAEEVALLDGARRALMGGDTEGALRALEKHARDFSDGALTADAAVIRIEALAARGDASGAISNARAFLSAFPGDPHVTHVQNLLEAHQGRETPEQVGAPR